MVVMKETKQAAVPSRRFVGYPGSRTMLPPPRWAALLLLALIVTACGDEAEEPPPSVEIPSWAKVAPAQIAEAKKYGVPVAFENDLGMRFVLIPAGTFLMGSPEGETREYRYPEDFADERPQHAVALTMPYYMQVTEVTNAQFRRFLPDHVSGIGEEWSFDGDDCPVVGVSWNNAVAFARWLSERDRERDFRLPSEAEWERASRAGTSTRYWWGDSEAEGWKYANANDPKTAEAEGFALGMWSRDDGYRATAPVASFPPNGYGLYDMLGNVYEWCRDWYGEYGREPIADPSGPASGEERVLKGGCWDSGPSNVRSAKRAHLLVDDIFTFIGFRLVSPLPEGE